MLHNLNTSYIPMVAIHTHSNTRSCHMVPAKPTVCHRVVHFVRTVEHGESTRRAIGEHVGGPKDPVYTSHYRVFGGPLGKLETFRRVGTSGGTR